MSNFKFDVCSTTGHGRLSSPWEGFKSFPATAATIWCSQSKSSYSCWLSHNALGDFLFIKNQLSTGKNFFLTPKTRMPTTFTKVAKPRWLSDSNCRPSQHKVSQVPAARLARFHHRFATWARRCVQNPVNVKRSNELKLQVGTWHDIILLLPNEDIYEHVCFDLCIKIFFIFFH